MYILTENESWCLNNQFNGYIVVYYQIGKLGVGGGVAPGKSPLHEINIFNLNKLCKESKPKQLKSIDKHGLYIHRQEPIKAIKDINLCSSV